MKSRNFIIKTVLLVFVIALTISCKEAKNNMDLNSINIAQNEEDFTVLLQEHLRAVTNKDLERLKTTLSPIGNMELIQPSMEIIYTVDGFLKFHEDFFKDVNSTLNFKIMSKSVGNKIGVATTEAIYREVNRNGKPYFNRLTVTYTLEKINQKWYVIKDHASSIEKTIY